jgi:hypothetical protein
MSGDDDLFSLLPSRSRARIAQAIGRRLVDVERIFSLDLDTFVDGGRRAPADFFRRNSGATRFVFDGGLGLAFSEWGEQLSVVLLPSSFEPDIGQQLSRLEESPDPLRRVLGRTCRDVRVWTYAEDFEADEAMECAVSFVLEGPEEVFYCTWLHGDMDADYVLPAEEVPLDRAASWMSVSTGETTSGHRSALAGRIERAAERFRPDYARQASHAALLKEFLRRMALWADALDRRDEWPLFDVAAVLYPERFSEADDLDLPQYAGAFRAALQAALNFADVAESPLVRGYGLPDPYAPLVRLLERGATLTTEHGMVYAGTAGMPRHPFPQSLDPGPGIPLDDASLDALDG